MAILTATAWPTNADLIADVAKLGYLDGSVLDVTYGYGVFWQKFKPDDFTACDIDPEKSPIGHSVDFRCLPISWRREFDTVVLDPPYKLNGTPTDSVDERYGVHLASTWQDRYANIMAGMNECMAVTRKYLLLKCMDQVVSGKKRWQTIDFVNHACGYGKMELVDRFDMLVTPRPQPEGRRQLHAQGNYSTLLVFEK